MKACIYNLFIFLMFFIVLSVPGTPIMISSIQELQNIGKEAAYPLDGHYILTQNIDASVTSGWNSGEGFEPIGSIQDPFTGIFDGAGFKITNLFINNSQMNHIGLFGFVSEGSLIQNVTLEGGSIQGDEWANVGSLAGSNFGSIVNSYAQIELKGNKHSSAGGLVGWNYGLIQNSSSSCTVSVPEGITWVSLGGIAGRNHGALVHCSSAGTVTAEKWSTLGGLVGRNYGIIANSHSASTITADDWSSLGGVAGINEDDMEGDSEGIIFNSQATGAVTGKQWSHAGGLAGRNKAVISYSHATGSVTATYSSTIGGLVGTNSFDDLSLDEEMGIILQSYATGSVTGETSSNAGGLAGINYGRISDSYATGWTRSDFYAGGLVARNELNEFDSTGAGGIISNCYSTGKVFGSQTIGGLAGSDSGTAIEYSYWDTNSSELLISAGGEGRTTGQMTYPHHENTYVQWNFQETWRADTDYSVNQGYPYLPSPPEYASVIVESNLPSVLPVNSIFIMHLTLRNTGIECWQAEESVYLGAVGNHDYLAPEQYWRIAQEQDIHHFQAYTYEIELYPQQTGTFTTQWQMIKEGAFWFGEIFSHEIEVVERTGLDSHLWHLFQ